MWIGEQRISLRNMSKNQRSYWRQMKRIYDEARADGFNMSGQEFIETYAPTLKIRTQQVQEATQLTGEMLLGYDREFDMARAFIDNLISDLSMVMPVTRRGRTRRRSNGELIKTALANRLKALVQQYGYAAVYDGWMALPYEIRAKVDSSAAGDRYDGYASALNIIDELVANSASGYDDFDGPEE